MTSKPSRVATITAPSPAGGCDWTSSELASLVKDVGGPVVSLLMPTHVPGPSSREDHIRLRNLLSRVTAVDDGIEPLVDALHKAASDAHFWSHPSRGLALFADTRSVRVYRVPEVLPELAVVGRRPHIVPLLPLLEGDGRFYLLELHQHGIRLHEGSKFDLREVVVSGLSGTAEVHQHGHADRSEVQRLVHPGHPTSPIHLGSAHEHGAKERALHYFRSVDAAIRPIIAGSDAPLLISGVEWLQPLYVEANHYHRLIPSGIHADTAALGTTELHDCAWKLIGRRFQEAELEELERHAQLRHLGQAIDDIHEVIGAIAAGRVSSLFVARGQSQWGSIDETATTVAAHAMRQANDEDLLNAAVVLGLRSGAQAWAVDTSVIPGGRGISARLRY